jgi:hypothetical protein
MMSGSVILPSFRSVAYLFPNTSSKDVKSSIRPEAECNAKIKPNAFKEDLFLHQHHQV